MWLSLLISFIVYLGTVYQIIKDYEWMSIKLFPLYNVDVVKRLYILLCLWLQHTTNYHRMIALQKNVASLKFYIFTMQEDDKLRLQTTILINKSKEIICYLSFSITFKWFIKLQETFAKQCYVLYCLSLSKWVKQLRVNSWWNYLGCYHRIIKWAWSLFNWTAKQTRFLTKIIMFLALGPLL